MGPVAVGGDDGYPPLVPFRALDAAHASKKCQQPGKITNLKIGLCSIRATRTTIAVDPRDLQACSLRAADVVDLTVSDMQNFVRLNAQLFQGPLEHTPMRFIGSHALRDNDELNRQGEIPGRDVFMVGIGNDRGGYVPDCVQDVERFGIERDVRRHPKEKVDIWGGVSADSEVP